MLPLSGIFDRRGGRRSWLIALAILAALMCLPVQAEESIKGDAQLSSIPFKKDEATHGSSAHVGGWAAWGILGFLSVGIGMYVLNSWRSKGIIKKRRAHTIARGVDNWSIFSRLVGLRKSPQLHQIASVRLSPQHSIHEVEWGGKRLLIGCSSSSMHVLASKSALEDASEESATLDTGEASQK